MGGSVIEVYLRGVLLVGSFGGCVVICCGLMGTLFCLLGGWFGAFAVILGFVGGLTLRV